MSKAKKQSYHCMVCEWEIVDNHKHLDGIQCPDCSGPVMPGRKHENEYVKLIHVQELLKLIEIRDSFNDWSTNYETYNTKVKNTIAWLERNAQVSNEARLQARISQLEYQLSQMSTEHSGGC